MPAELVAGIDRIERNRSRFISEAVRQELQRRQRREHRTGPDRLGGDPPRRNQRPARSRRRCGRELGPCPRLAGKGTSTLPRGTVVLVDLEPTLGQEQRSTRPSHALVDQLRSIDEQCIRQRHGPWPEAELAAIDAGLRLYLGLDPDPD